MNETNFEAIKAEILKRAKEAHACSEQYGRAYKSQTLQELCNVIKDNFNWAFKNKVITAELLMQFRVDFAANEIYVNVSVQSGYLLCDSTTVVAYGNATVVAYGNATVVAYDCATVVAYGNATVVAYDNATVVAYGNATVVAHGNATVKADGNATVEAHDNATVKAYDSATVVAYESATVEAYDNTYCTSYSAIECKLSDNAIYRLRSTNTVYFASDEIKFNKQTI